MKLLVPTDFSKNAQRAVDYAVKIADKAHAEIILLHAYQIIDTESPTRKLLFEEYNYSIARKLHDELKTQRSRIAKLNSAIKVTAELSDNGAKKAIIEASTGTDLIVMGTQGASGLKKIFMGSTTASIIGNAAVPVLAIPRQYNWKEPKNILLATNRFEINPEILNPIFKLAELFDARIHVVVFTDTDNKEITDYARNESGLSNYQKELEKLSRSIAVTSAHLEGSEFEDTLQQYMDKHAIDILAMVTYKRSFFEAIFNRSMTKKMAYRTSIPLLAIPSGDV